MRFPGWSLTTLLLIAPALPAQPQQPPQTPPLNVPANDKLQTLLRDWEARMKSIQSIEATVIRTETDDVTKAKEVFEGTAKFLRPDRADLYMRKQGNPEAYERFLLTGPFVYEFLPKQKVIRAHQLPQRAPGQPAVDDNFMGLLFGMSAQEAQRRYDLTLTGQDGNYYYLNVLPRLPADKAEFTKARLALYAAGSPRAYLPREIQFVQPNGNSIAWDIPKIDANAPLRATDFVKPQVPRDWKLVTVPPPAAAVAPPGPPPTKVRPSGGN
jgi:TIGR03009 family protein